ncbi:hypothetical protein AB0M43_23850 [Longispora sp. NPDC051575]|uniref:hypothetical protein n=1 Tax=Longispora sp. NPDC051575 TaxID=3154943 RepID=UPI00342FE465
MTDIGAVSAIFPHHASRRSAAGPVGGRRGFSVEAVEDLARLILATITSNRPPDEIVIDLAAARTCSHHLPLALATSYTVAAEYGTVLCVANAHGMVLRALRCGRVLNLLASTAAGSSGPDRLLPLFLPPGRTLPSL